MDGGTDGLYEFINEDGSPIEMAPGGVGAEPQDATASSKGGSGGLFKTAIMQLSQDTYFKAVVLSMWDNVIGPRCKQVRSYGSAGWPGFAIPSAGANKLMSGILSGGCRCGWAKIGSTTDSISVCFPS